MAGDDAEVKALLDSGADVNEAFEDGRPAPPPRLHTETRQARFTSHHAQFQPRHIGQLGKFAGGHAAARK